MHESENSLKTLAQSILELDLERAAEVVRDLSKAGIPPITIIEEGVAKGMTDVGERYQSGEYHMPELLYAEEVMRKCLAELNPRGSPDEALHLTKDAQQRLEELSRSWIGPLSSCVTRLFRYDEERKRQST
jgi:methanogenic corrinoid protein MtbC1